MGYISSQLISQADVKELRQTFQTFDINGDGKISTSELVEGYTKILGRPGAASEAQLIMSAVDIDESGFIDYSEFV